MGIKAFGKPEGFNKTPEGFAETLTAFAQYVADNFGRSKYHYQGHRVKNLNFQSSEI